MKMTYLNERFCVHDWNWKRTNLLFFFIYLHGQLKRSCCVKFFLNVGESDLLSAQDEKNNENSILIRNELHLIVFCFFCFVWETWLNYMFRMCAICIYESDLALNTEYIFLYTFYNNKTNFFFFYYGLRIMRTDSPNVIRCKINVNFFLILKIFYSLLIFLQNFWFFFSYF